MRRIVGYFLSLLAGAGIGGMFVRQKADVKYIKMKQMSDKHLEMFKLMNQWVRIKQEGKSIVGYFHENNYRTIAIYGMNYIGETLINELKDSEICVKYGIDRNVDEMTADIEVIRPEEHMPEVDAVVVTAFVFFDEIYEALLKNGSDCPILSIKDIISAV